MGWKPRAISKNAGPPDLFGAELPAKKLMPHPSNLFPPFFLYTRLNTGSPLYIPKLYLRSQHNVVEGIKAVAIGRHKAYTHSCLRGLH